MERHYRFAGVEIAVSMPEQLFYEDEYRLAPFAVERTAAPQRFCFEKVQELEPPSGTCVMRDPRFWIYSDGQAQIRYIGAVNRSLDGAYIRVAQRGDLHHVQVRAGAIRERITTKAVLNALGVEHLMARTGGFVFHCAYIEWQGKAILFTAPSETGKSTQAELWRSLRGAEIINGDRAAVRIAGGTVIAEGIPFAGSSSYCLNRSLPVAAVVYLGQAPATSIRRMKGYEAFARVWEGCSVNTWDRTDVSLVSDAVRQVAESVPVYHLPCTPDESAVIALENAIKKQVNL